MAISTVLYFNGTLIEGVISWGETRDSRIEAETIPRRHGAYVDAKQYLDPRTIDIKGKIVKNTVDDLRTSLDALNELIETGRGALMLHDDRFLYAEKQNFTFDYIDGTRGAGIIYDLSFMADDPFYYALSPVSQDITLSGSGSEAITIALDEHGAPIAVAGNADCDPVITITPSGSYTEIILINNQGDIERRFSFVAAGSSGDEIMINAIDKLCFRNGINALSYFYGSFFQLRAGEINPLVYSGPAGTMKVEYRPRYF